MTVKSHSVALTCSINNFTIRKPQFHMFGLCFWFLFLKEEEEEVETKDDTNKKSPSLRWVVQHTLFPVMRTDFSPPKRFANDGSVVQIACLENLYKIFERC